MAIWWNIIALLLIWDALYLTTTVAAQDRGFELLFESNLKEFDNVPLKMDGILPTWLRGTLMRNGVGRFEVGPRHFEHGLDGFAKLSSFKIDGRNNTVLFSTKFIQSTFYQESERDDTMAPYMTFGRVEPPFGYSDVMKTFIHGTDNANVNVVSYGHPTGGGPEVAALSDIWRSYAIDSESLTTLRRVDPPLPGGGILSSVIPPLTSSHPLPEYNSGGSHINIAAQMNPIPGQKHEISLVRIKTMDERELITKIYVDRLPYMHSFSLTKRFVVLFANPLFVSLPLLLKHGTPSESLVWDAESKTDVYVIDLKTADVIRLQTEAALMLHHVNAWEESEHQICVDVVTHKNNNFLKTFQLSVLRNKSKRDAVPINIQLKRYILNLKTRLVSIHLFETQQELTNTLDMPTFNENYRFRKYCYVYGVTFGSDNKTFGNCSIIKKDVCRPHNDKVWHIDNHYPTEAVFVARPGVVREDDGVLLSVVLNGDHKQSYLAVFDARTLTLTQRLHLPAIVPLTMHGSFLAAANNYDFGS